MSAAGGARGSVAAVGARVNSEQSVSVVLFQVGARRCALPVSAVRGVVLPRALDGVAGVERSAVLGVVRDGAAAIPVLDARRWLGVEGPVPPRPRWIVAHCLGRRLALAVDQVDRVCLAAVADDAPGVERPRVSRYFTVQGALCAEPDLAAMTSLAHPEA